MDIDAVAPDLRQATKKLAVTDPSKAWMRTVLRAATRVMRVPRFDGVTVSAVRSGRLRMRIYRPVNRRLDGGLFWVHGGGLMFGDARQDEKLCAETARDLGIAVVSANYRFAPDHPFPAPLDDVRASWLWMLEHADALGVAPDRIVAGGESAGAGLVAALVQRVHDEGGVQPIAQWLFAPMIDDRTAADRSLDGIDHWVWNNATNRVGWSGYLRAAFGGDDVPAYAAAARRTDLTDLPPAYIAVGDIELFFDEDAEYARRLREAGVPVELDVVPGGPHGFENWASTSESSVALMRRARSWLAAALA